MFTINDIFDRNRSISIERVNEFLTRKSIEHKCTELRKIEFKLEDWSWDLYIDDNYFKMVLVTSTDKHINRHVAEKACLEVTNLIKVLKAHYTSYEYVEEDDGNKLVKYNILIFKFESYCYNMYDFSRLFYDGLNIILCGYNEYYMHYNQIESELPGAPIGFRNFDNDEVRQESQSTNRYRIGFV